jgi:hypothetical protein
MLEWIKVLGPIVISWPMAAIFGLFLFKGDLHTLLQRLRETSGSKLELGPIKAELGKVAEDGRGVIEQLRQITEVMAKSRRLELEITSQSFGPMFSKDQQAELKAHIAELTQLSSKA